MRFTKRPTIRESVFDTSDLSYTHTHNNINTHTSETKPKKTWRASSFFFLLSLLRIGRTPRAPKGQKSVYTRARKTDARSPAPPKTSSSLWSRDDVHGPTRLFTHSFRTKRNRIEFICLFYSTTNAGGNGLYYFFIFYRSRAATTNAAHHVRRANKYTPHGIVRDHGQAIHVVFIVQFDRYISVFRSM